DPRDRGLAVEDRYLAAQPFEGSERVKKGEQGQRLEIDVPFYVAGEHVPLRAGPPHAGGKHDGKSRVPAASVSARPPEAAGSRGDRARSRPADRSGGRGTPDRAPFVWRPRPPPPGR